MALTTNLISYYKLDDNLATTAVLDAHGDNDGVCTVNTDTLDADGIIENSLNFPHDNTKKINIADGGDLSFTPGTDSYSISLWVYRNVIGDYHIVMSDGTEAETSYYFRINNVNTLTAWAQDGTTQFAFSSTSTIPATTWTHCVLTVSTTTAKMYINGVYEATDSVDAGTPTSDGVIIGTSGTASHPMNGRVDEVGIWSKVLTDGGVDLTETATGEVAELYNSGDGFAYPFTVIVNKTVEPAVQTLSLSGETSKAIVLDSPLSLSTSLTALAPVPVITPPKIYEVTSALSLNLMFHVPQVNIKDNTDRNPNYGTKSTKIISNLDIPDGIGGVMNLLPETSHVLSKKRVGLGM